MRRTSISTIKVKNRARTAEVGKTQRGKKILVISEELAVMERLASVRLVTWNCQGNSVTRRKTA